MQVFTPESAIKNTQLDAGFYPTKIGMNFDVCFDPRISAIKASNLMQALTPGTNYPNSTLSQLDFCFLSILMEYDRTGNFTIDYEQKKKSNLFIIRKKLSVRSYSFQFERRRKIQLYEFILARSFVCRNKKKCFPKRTRDNQSLRPQ